MKPTLVQYEAPGWGVGEVWLDDDGVVFYSELPRPKRTSPGTVPGHVLAGRLVAYFEGEPDDFADVALRLDDGFYGDCARVLRAVPRGEVVTYGELAALAGYPGAARAACARCELAPFLPVHRVVAANGIGSWGGFGIDYKRRLLELEDVAL
jgi:methylated-DNA-[protein]-cysteine S-methyltransferase